MFGLCCRRDDTFPDPIQTSSSNTKTQKNLKFQAHPPYFSKAQSIYDDPLRSPPKIYTQMGIEFYEDGILPHIRTTAQKVVLINCKILGSVEFIDQKGIAFKGEIIIKDNSSIGNLKNTLKNAKISKIVALNRFAYATHYHNTCFENILTSAKEIYLNNCTILGAIAFFDKNGHPFKGKVNIGENVVIVDRETTAMNANIFFYTDTSSKQNIEITS